MKFKVTKAQFDALSDDMKAEYKAEGEEYILTVEGGEDTGALKRAKEHEKTRRQAAETKLTETQTKLTETQSELETLSDSAGSGDKDVAKLEAKWTKKFSDRETELSGERDGFKGEIQRLMVDNVAMDMARNLSDSPGLLIPHIKSRLTVEMVNGKAVTKVKDADGELSALTVDELTSEFKSNNDFASVIRGGEGSGSGASGGQGKGGQQPSKPDFAKASTKEVADYLTSQKAKGA